LIERNPNSELQSSLVVHYLSRQRKPLLLRPFQVKFIRGPGDTSSWREAGRKSQLESFQRDDCDKARQGRSIEMQNEIISQYEALIPWVRSLNKEGDQIWLTPMMPGKWSAGEIISHLMFWDRFILEKRLPLMKPGVTLPPAGVDPEKMNGLASEYALSGISKKALILEFVTVREKLLDQLKSIPGEEFHADLTVNISTLSVYSYIKGMIEHDRHHQKQIQFFLRAGREE
jgi:hypothetical protein